jgi:hypothetical protein
VSDAESANSVEGCVESRCIAMITGWAFRPNSMAPVRLRFSFRQEALGECAASIFRWDTGNRIAGFAWAIPVRTPPLDSALIEVVDADTNMPLRDAPDARRDRAIVPIEHVPRGTGATPRPSVPVVQSSRVTALPLADELRDEVRRWADVGLVPRLWWRDDDLTADTERFRTLATLARTRQVPCLVAVIPERCDPRLGDATHAMSELRFAQHGFGHLNHQPEGELKNEFGAERASDAVAFEVREGRDKLRRVFEERLLPVMVGPWNRFAPNHSVALVEAGFLGWSGFFSEPCRPNHPQLKRVDCHVDILRWGQRATLAPPAAIMARIVALMARSRRNGQGNGSHASVPAPVGLLTHHLAMDEKAWAFVRAFFDHSTSLSGLRWEDPNALFGFAENKQASMDAAAD